MINIRGREVSRIEGFSDAVFGFALTLLVVSLEVPESFDGLKQILGGFVPFAITFALGEHRGGNCVNPHGADRADPVDLDGRRHLRTAGAAIPTEGDLTLT